MESQDVPEDFGEFQECSKEFQRRPMGFQGVSGGPRALQGLVQGRFQVSGGPRGTYL